MAIYRNVNMSFWTDSKVVDDFTPEEKYFYLYLLTNPHTNICGCYEISMKQMESETGYNTDTVKRLIHRMQENHGVIRYDEQTKEVLIVNWHKYNWTKSEKVMKAVVEAAQSIKSDSFKAYIYNTISIRYGYTMEIQSVSVSVSASDTVSESMDADEQRPAPAPAKKRFEPPSVEEVAEYCKERQNRINPQHFVDFYTANGWVQGKGKPIKDWRAAVRNWEQRDQSSGPVRSRGTPEQPHSSSIDMADVAKLVNCF